MLESIGRHFKGSGNPSMGRLWAAQVLSEKIKKDLGLTLRVVIRQNEIKLLATDQPTAAAANLRIKTLWRLVKQTPSLARVTKLKIKTESTKADYGPI